MDLDGSLIRSIVCCHVGRPTTFLNAALATEEAMMLVVGWWFTSALLAVLLVVYSGMYVVDGEVVDGEVEWWGLGWG